ncbi:MAG: hypothetical protein R3236_02250 [Phycisphaeraceae bacterium]|nr:hypothetical protein [Phycisphaeraceae bacterium]
MSRCLTGWMTLIMVLTLGPAFALASPVATAGEVAREDVPMPETVQNLVADLEDEEYAVRQRATEKLAKLGPKGLGLIRDFHAAATDPEVRNRLQQVIQAIENREQPGGEVVDGIRLGVKASQETIRPGETVTIETFMTNTTNHLIQIQVGYTPTGNYFESGSALHQLATRLEAGHPEGKVVKEWKRATPQVMVCGTGARAIYKTLRPGQTVTYSCPVTYHQLKNRTAARLMERSREVLNALQVGPRGHWQIVIGQGGVIQLRMQHHISPPREPRKTQIHEWAGTVTSNTIELTVLPEPEEATETPIAVEEVTR